MNKIWKGCAPSNFRAGRPSGLRPTAIVIHIMEGSIGSADNWFNNPASSVSAHYGVAKSGEVHQYVDEHDTAFHAGTVVRPTWAGIVPGVNPNYYTVGIEHEGEAEDPWPWPAAQIAASAALVGEIAARWSIPADLNHVVPHRSIRASKTCPGLAVKIEDILASIPAGGPPPLPAPSITNVQVLTNANVRFGEPSTTARVVRVLPALTRVTVAGFTDSGQRVLGNSFWYKDAEGNFIWAGATDVPHPI
jgi:hypothetical protein